MRRVTPNGGQCFAQWAGAHGSLGASNWIVNVIALSNDASAQRCPRSGQPTETWNIRGKLLKRSVLYDHSRALGCKLGEQSPARADGGCVGHRVHGTHCSVEGLWRRDQCEW